MIDIFILSSETYHYIEQPYSKINDSKWLMHLVWSTKQNLLNKVDSGSESLPNHSGKL